MKKPFLLIFSLFHLSAPCVFANDISVFEIEGISIGDSLLDYFSEKTIKDSIMHDYYYNNKFAKVEFWNLDLEKYDVLSAHIKPNDKKYIIYDLSGAILFKENVSDCYVEKNKIDNELITLFGYALRNDSGRQFHWADETNRSIYERVDYEFPSGNSIKIICYDWSLAIGHTDHLSIGIETREFNEWLQNF